MLSRFLQARYKATICNPASEAPSPIRINNVICHANLGCPINICQVAIALNGRANPKVFPACVSKCRETNTTLSVFQSGRLVIVGAKSIDIALYAAHNFARALRKVLLIPAQVHNFEVDNLVCDFKLGFQLNLDLFLNDHELTAQWEYEFFRGLSYKPYGSGKSVVSFVLFTSGCGIITGAKSEEMLLKAYTTHYPDFVAYTLGGEYRTQAPSTTRVREWSDKLTKLPSNRKRKREEGDDSAVE